MSLRSFVLRQLQSRLADRRPPDFIVGGKENPYLRRWYVIPRNRWFNVYFHHFLRSDDDRALHDHPWWSLSWILEGGYCEWLPGYTIDPDTWEPMPDAQNPQIHWRPEGYIGWRKGAGLHRVQLNPRLSPDGTRFIEDPAWTLFITGPKYREWGFACPKGWKPWQQFVHPNDKGLPGPGCD